MYLLLSGEGASDIGSCDMGLAACSGRQFHEGPMSIIVDQLIELSQEFELSYLENNLTYFISETYLAKNKAPRIKKNISLRGKKKPAETKYYFENARSLALAAKKKSEDINDKVIAVLFRDSDGTASAGRGNWQNKLNSMIKGFEIENFDFGIPMIPKPKSEAWLLCAVKNIPYQACGNLENESGNDRGDSHLKLQLSAALNGNDSVAEINEMLKNKRINVELIDMSSFNKFKSLLAIKIKLALKR